MGQMSPMHWICLVSHRRWHLLIPWKINRCVIAWSKPGQPSHAAIILVGRSIDQGNRPCAVLVGDLSWSSNRQLMSLTFGERSGCNQCAYLKAADDSRL